MKKVIYVFSFIIIILSCKKSNERTCFKGSGNEIQQIVSLEKFTFDGFSIFNDLNVELIADTTDYVEINSYENKINFVSFEMKDSLLEIKDLNKCDFLRNYDKKTNIKIHYKKITVLKLSGNGHITSLDTIQNDVLHLYSQSSNSEINLKVKAKSLIMKFVNGTLSGNIDGVAQNSNIFHFGRSKINFGNLEVENLNLSNKSDANLSLFVTNNLVLELLSLGNIYYKGGANAQVIENRFGSEVIQYN